jgi:hypothetical protein
MTTVIKVNTDNWETYIVGKLFDVPFVASGCFNNGVQTLLKPKSEDDIDKGNCITISPVDGYAFYQEEDFLGRGGAGSSIIIIRNDNLNRYNGQYIASIIRRTFSSWTYADMGNKDVVKEAKIKLPSKNGEPDWEYMKEYMVEIENKCIAKLKNLL